MIGASYLLIANRAALSGAGSALFIQAIPWAVLGSYLLGVGVALYFRAADRVRHQSIGRTVFQESESERLAGVAIPEPALG